MLSVKNTPIMVSVFMLKVSMPSVLILNVIILSVVVLSVVAPKKEHEASERTAFTDKGPIL
jgi:hypothetical protein